MPDPTAGMTKDQLKKFFSKRMQQRVLVYEGRIVALENSVQQLTHELAQALKQGMTQVGGAIYLRPPECIPYLDKPRWKGGFGVVSSDSQRIYTVSFDTAVGYWVCSCPAGKNRGTCKHLEKYGRPGKVKGKQPTPQFVAPPAGAQPFPAQRRPTRQFATDTEV